MDVTLRNKRKKQDHYLHIRGNLWQSSWLFLMVFSSFSKNALTYNENKIKRMNDTDNNIIWKRNGFLNINVFVLCLNLPNIVKLTHKYSFTI